MKSTTVSQLKTSLSAYLRQGKTGEEALIAEHDRPIARLLHLASPMSLPKHLKNVEKECLLKRGEKLLSADFWNLIRPADPQAAVSSTVLRQREEGW